MIKLADLNVKTVINTLQMLEKIEKNMNVMRREIQDIKKDTTKISKDEKYSM